MLLFMVVVVVVADIAAVKVCVVVVAVDAVAHCVDAWCCFDSLLMLWLLRSWLAAG